MERGGKMKIREKAGLQMKKYKIDRQIQASGFFE